MDEKRTTLEEALGISKAMKGLTARTGRPPTVKAIDRYIQLENRLERTKTGSAEESRILFQLSSLEAIDGVTIEDVQQRKEELSK